LGFGVAARKMAAQQAAAANKLEQQLTGLAADNNAQLKPALAHLKSVVSILDNNQKSLDETVTLLYPTTRNLVDVVGSGGWYDATVINATNPVTLLGGKGPTTVPLPQNLGDLLGVGQLTKASGG